MGVARVLLPLLISASLFGAPELRLVNTAVGPVSIALSTNGPAQTVEAQNAGDGSLNLQVSSNVTWIVPSVGAQRACAQGLPGNCIPIQLALQTGSLAKGTYTGTVTVNDPNAVDAPQTVTVTVQMGGGVPAQVDLYAAPGGAAAEQSFTTNSNLSWKVSGTNTSWLAISTNGAGSFGFNLPAVVYAIKGTPQAGMAAGNYSASVAFSGSSVAAENTTVPVTLHVTTQAIASAYPQSLSFRIVQGGAPQTQFIGVGNTGPNILTLNGSFSSSAAWLSAEMDGQTYAAVTADPTGLAPGIYTATLAIGSTSANSPSNVAVQLEVIPVGPPWAYFQGVVNNATFEAGDNVAPGEIVAVFGEQFSSLSPQTGSQLPLVTTLGGTQVLVNSTPAPLYYSSYGQVNFQIPYGTPSGTALVAVSRNGQLGNKVSVQVAPIAPRLLLVQNQDGSYPIPAIVGGHPAKVGDTLVIYAIGLGATSPPATTGAAAPASPLAQVTPLPNVLFGGEGIVSGTPAVPLFVGLTPGFVGLYQINVTIPAGTPSGNNVQVDLNMSGTISNQVQIAIQ
jgi:uncharacterized protein (TIGR03437 family)